MFRKTGSRVLFAAMALVSFVATPGQAQQTEAVNDGAFATENAILDTSILFAIGAREARQELRGAFGWPTYQEGLVEGVYFRFDPDGYARFAPTPRLDTDVFEVICRPRTHVCLARKDGLLVSLNTRAQVELQVENIGASDTFAVAEGITELPLPAAALQQLETPVEILLASGAELVVRRADQEVERISLKGFSAVTAYLRWVAARQDYLVLPQGWPVPNSGTVAQTPGLIQTTRWQSPMPQPSYLSESSTPPAALIQDAQSLNADESTDVTSELKSLRSILERREVADQAQLPGSVHGQDIWRLQQMVEQLSEEVQALQNAGRESAQMPAFPDTRDGKSESSMPGISFADRLDYLMTEIGLEPDVALLLLQQGEAALPPAEEQTDPVEELLSELRENLPHLPDVTAAQEAMPAQDYQLLTEYFRSVFNDGLKPQTTN